MLKITSILCESQKYPHAPEIDMSKDLDIWEKKNYGTPGSSGVPAIDSPKGSVDAGSETSTGISETPWTATQQIPPEVQEIANGLVSGLQKQLIRLMQTIYVRN